MKKCLTTLILGAAFTAAALDDGFEPYQTITDRMPFGRPPAAFDTDGPTASAPARADGEGERGEPAADPEREKAAERIRAAVRVCALNVPPDGEPVVGFTDAAYTPPRSHLLAKGQRADGWTVLEIDVASCSAVLEREGVAVSVRLGGGAGVAVTREPRALKAPSPPRKAAKRSRKSRKSPPFRSRG